MADGDLTSLANAREFLQKPVSDTEQDDVIESLITRASKVIASYTEREFTATADATREFSYNGNGYLDLAPYDLSTVTEVVIDSDTDSPTILVEGDNYRLWPKPPVNGVYTGMQIYTTSAGSTRWPTRTVSITGDWGFEAVPTDVEHACIVTVSIWLRRDVAAFATNMNLDEARVERPESLPSAIRSMLDQYKRVTYR